MPGSNAHHDTSDLDRSMEDIGSRSREGLGRPRVMGDALRYYEEKVFVNSDVCIYKKKKCTRSLNNKHYISVIIYP